MDDTTAADMERELALVAAALTEPEDDECVLCYVAGMVGAFGCDHTLRWVRRWRDLRRPRATGLERRMEARGGYCDCEVFMNGWSLRADLMVLDDDGELTAPDVLPPCAGVGSRSSQPCTNWEPWRRRGW